MKEKPFIGMGENPDGPDLPIGFGMHLGQDSDALSNYGKLTKQQQSAIIEYIQDSRTGEDAQNRILHAVQCLKENKLHGILGG